MTAKLGAWFGWIIAAAIVVSICAGLFLIGGPGEARAKKNDRARMDALKDTAASIACYAKNIGALPDTIDPIKAAVEDSDSGIYGSKECLYVDWENDPVSGAEFEYIRKDAKSFEICAHFERADVPNSNSDYSYSRNTDVLIGIRKTRTKAGRHCYIGRGWE